jgi:hypothetical protein
MANDIIKSINGNDIKNGTALVGCLPTGSQENLKLNDYVVNTPTISDIQSKYDEKFDDPRYYTGDTIE